MTHHLPALRFHALAWAYEPIAMRLCRAHRWRPAVVDAIAPAPGLRILDLGCGPGTLARRIAERAPAAVVVGVDPDPVMLARARAVLGPRVPLLRASATALPFAGAFDVCTASLVFHHLRPADKGLALGEARRVLRPGGRLVLADWGPPDTAAGRAAFAVTQVFDGRAVTAEHADGRFAARLCASGFVDVAEQGRWPTPVGTLCLYVGHKPSSARKPRMSPATRVGASRCGQWPSSG